MRLLTILVRYGLEQYPRAQEELEAVLSRQLPEVDRDIVVVDNALHPSVVQVSAARALIGGDNANREFSGFDRCVEWVGASLTQYDFVLFATSAFNTLYTEYITRVRPALLAAARGRSVCIGHIDHYNEPVRVGWFVSQHWVRTCFFILPPVQVKALGSFVSIRSGAGLFSGDPAAPFRPDAPLSANYRRYLIDWLTGHDIGQGVRWHSGVALTRDTLESFEQKTICILNEHLLSARLRALGCSLVDVTWLARRLEPVEDPARIPWHLGWRSQLTGREEPLKAAATRDRGPNDEF